MKCKWLEGAWIAALFFAVPAAAVLMSHGPQTAVADDEPQGRIVDITDGNEDQARATGEENDAAEPALPKYWIGLQGRTIDSAVLRTQFQLADDVGVVVENVVPDSPAAKAGLQQHDIIVAVNGEPVSDMSALQQVVADSQAKPIKLKVIRLAQEETVAVTPEERPHELPAGLLGQQEQALDLQGPQGLEQLFRQFQLNGAPDAARLRVFGPGMMPGIQQHHFNLNQMPAGVSVSITREGDQPPQITVKRGDETWTVQGDDEESLKKLPEELRPFVKQMLAGTKAGARQFNGAPQFNQFNFEDLRGALPGAFEGFDPDAMSRQRNEANRRLLEQMQQMEQRLQELEQQFHDGPTDDSSQGDDPT